MSEYKFKSGQEVYIAQINTLAGVKEKRYYIQEYWCDSGHQREYLDLGILFDNKFDAENKCRSLLGLPKLKTERDIFIEKFITYCNKDCDIYHGTSATQLGFIGGISYDAGARFNE